MSRRNKIGVAMLVVPFLAVVALCLWVLAESDLWAVLGVVLAISFVAGWFILGAKLACDD